jgi:leader peptidase (prepilin peptidase)/N-methyltransferase
MMVPHETLGTMKMIVAPLDFRQLWPMYLLFMAMIAALLAASLIDAELFMIPIEIPWVMAALGIIVHTIIDKPSMPGALNVVPTAGALAAGGTIGLLITLALWRIGVIPVSFPQGEPMLDVPPNPPAASPPDGVIDYQHVEPPPPSPAPPMTRAELNRELRKEMAFLLPPMLMSAAFYFMVTQIASIGQWWNALVVQHYWLSGLLGALLGALVGGLVVWVTRILGSLAFGRLAMGLGDVHLMFGVGAIIGAGCATIAFFLAPFFGIFLALYMFVTGKKRELPYGPYLSLATAFVLLFCCRIEVYLMPGIEGLSIMIRQMMGG